LTAREPFSPGDRVTVTGGRTVYTILSVRDEAFTVGGIQQVCRITDDIRTISMRAAHLTLLKTGTPT